MTSTYIYFKHFKIAANGTEIEFLPETVMHSVEMREFSYLIFRELILGKLESKITTFAVLKHWTLIVGKF